MLKLQPTGTFSFHRSIFSTHLRETVSPPPLSVPLHFFLSASRSHPTRPRLPSPSLFLSLPSPTLLHGGQRTEARRRRLAGARGGGAGSGRRREARRCGAGARPQRRPLPDPVFFLFFMQNFLTPLFFPFFLFLMQFF